MGDVARLMNGSMIAPPIDPVHIQRYFRDLKALEAVDELVPVNTVASGADLKRASQYGTHSSVTEYLPAICRKKTGKTSGANNT